MDMYEELIKQFKEKLNDLQERRLELREAYESDLPASFQYAKLTGQVLATYDAIIAIQELELERLGGKLNV